MVLSYHLYFTHKLDQTLYPNNILSYYITSYEICADDGAELFSAEEDIETLSDSTVSQPGSVV